MKDVKVKKMEWLKKELQKLSGSSPSSSPTINETTLLGFSTKLYEKGYSGLDIIQLLENPNSIKIENLTEAKRYELLFAFNKIRKEFRNEKLLLLFMLHFIFLSLEQSLENISFM
jgi:hypothetical protein